MNPALLRVLQITYTVISVGIPLLLAASGVLGIMYVNQLNGGGNSNENVQIVFMGIYMIVFAMTLFTFEILQLLPIKSLDDMYKKNFGFLYGPIGRGSYTLMFVHRQHAISLP